MVVHIKTDGLPAVSQFQVSPTRHSHKMSNRLVIGRPPRIGGIQWGEQRLENQTSSALLRKFKVHLVQQFVFGLTAISNPVMDEFRWLYLIIYSWDQYWDQSWSNYGYWRPCWEHQWCCHLQNFYLSRVQEHQYVANSLLFCDCYSSWAFVYSVGYLAGSDFWKQKCWSLLQGLMRPWATSEDNSFSHESHILCIPADKGRHMK